MNSTSRIKEINEKVLKAKALLEELNKDASDFPALSRNSERALTSIKMLELNISDLILYDLISSS